MAAGTLLSACLAAGAQQPQNAITLPPSPATLSSQPTTTFTGSVVTDKPTDGVVELSLDDAIARGLRNNIGVILSGTSVNSARGQRLEQLQALLPVVDASLRESVQQVNLASEGFRIPGFPQVVGPFAYTDLRATVAWSLLNVASLQNYLAAKHNFASAGLSAEDARDMVVLTVGNAYLLVVSDASRVTAAQAQVDTSKVSLDQAVSNHEAGTAPLLDELRARVDYQTQQQTLISAQNTYEKDKIALARVIGLPLEQKFALVDSAPYQKLDDLNPEQSVQQALEKRRDLAAASEQARGAERARAAATAERLPTIDFEGDYGDIGPNFGTSHGTGDAAGALSVPLFAEGKLRGDADLAQAQLDEKRARLSDLRGQVGADVRDAILDVQSAQKQVEVAHSNAQLAAEALSEAQQRYAAGVSDNLAVSQALQSVAQANEQYIGSLYQHNIAKLSLARALGVAQSYRTYVGGK